MRKRERETDSEEVREGERERGERLSHTRTRALKGKKGSQKLFKIFGNSGEEIFGNSIFLFFLNVTAY